MSDYVDERLAVGAASLEQEATVHSPAGVRARGDQRRRRHTATMAVVPVAVLAIAGTVGLMWRPSGGPVRPGLGSLPSVSQTRIPAVGTSPIPAKSAASAPLATTATSAISAMPIATVDLTRHTMTVVDAQGKVVRTLQITAGSARNPTPAGTFTVVGMNPSEKISSPLGADIYTMTVSSFIALSNGPAIFAAPWAHDSIGIDNVMHGQIGLDTDDAAWLYHRLAFGDTIRIDAGDR